MTEPDWQTPADRDDLRWWWDLAPTLRWTWASTFADTAPHWYINHPRTPGMEVADFVRLGRVIRTFGEPGRFYSRTNLYLFSEDRRHKWWAMWGNPPQPRDVGLVNLAHADKAYGPQRDFDEAFLATLRLGESDA